jgi:ribosomal protein S18 acetylase RimI-like enzyme
VNPRIRRARAEDARAIAEVHVASWKDAYAGILPHAILDGLTLRGTAAAWEKRIHGLGRGESVVVAELDGAVVAFSAAGPTMDPTDLAGFAAEVSYLYVHPSFVGAGIGGALLAHVLARFEREGYRWVMIAVLEENAAARGFYEHLGLRLDGARWLDRRFGARVVRYAKALNPVVDFESLRRSRA